MKSEGLHNFLELFFKYGFNAVLWIGILNPCFLCFSGVGYLGSVLIFCYLIIVQKYLKQAFRVRLFKIIVIIVALCVRLLLSTFFVIFTLFFSHVEYCLGKNQIHGFGYFQIFLTAVNRFDGKTGVFGHSGIVCNDK